MINKKKALSPVITTILLILLAIVLASIVLLWGQGFIKESLVKFDPALNEDRPIEELCDKVNFVGQVQGNSLIMNNLGEIPIHRINIKASSDVSSDSEEIEINLNVGASRTILTSLSLVGKQIEVTPILLGKNKNEEISQYSCSNNAKII
jgi:flagellin-like protein